VSRRRRTRQQDRKQTQRGITRVQIGLVAGVAILMVLTFIVLSQLGGGEQAASQSAAEPAGTQSEAAASASDALGTFAGVDLSTIETGQSEDGAPALGPADAPVTIVEYADYQCPHCRNFSVNTLPEVVKNYVVPGKVRYVYKNATVLGEESQWAAMAALCAADQGHFWEYDELLFNRQQGENQGTFSRDNLKQFAADLGLDTATFNECLDSNKYASKVADQTQEARSRGVKGTPSFFVNDEFVEGAVPYDQLKEIIDKHLEDAS
jgi:protein-disulfide isomerase